MASKKTVHTHKNAWIIISLLVVILVGVSILEKESAPLLTHPAVTPSTKSFDFDNQTINLGDQQLTFVNGDYQDSSTSATIKDRSISPSGNRAGAILISNSGGSGTFYYLVGAMKEDGKEKYSSPVFIGDRTKIVSVGVDYPQTEENGEITVEYLDRPANAPMSADPTEKMTAKYAFQDNGELIAVLH